jgi:hypothetical protein
LRVDYTWPVAVWLDGTILYEVGQVFGAALAGFDVTQMRSSYGIGVQASGDPDHAFQALIALGTETFDRGAGIDSFRFVLGTSAGF